MRIGFVLYSDGWGGAENVVHELAKALQLSGHQTAVVLNHEIAQYFEDIPGAKLLDIGPLFNRRSLVRSILGRSDALATSAPDPDNGRALGAVLRSVRHSCMRGRLAQFMINEDVDVVSVHLEEAIRGCLPSLARSGIPVVVTLHSPFIGIPQDRTRGFIKGRRRRSLIRSLEAASGLTYQSSCELDSLSFLPTPLCCQIATIPNGVDVAVLKAGPWSEGADDGFKIIYMGGSRWQKGGDLAVRTMALLQDLKDVQLHMLGNIPEGHSIRKLASELGIEDRVRFHGFIPPPRVYDHLSSADLLLIPSVSEGFSVTAVEGMALGKPIVGTNVGGIPTAVRSGRNAILVEPDPGRLAEAVTELYHDPTRRRTMSEINRADSEKYDWGLICEQYLDHFTRVAERGPVGKTAQKHRSPQRTRA